MAHEHPILSMPLIKRTDANDENPLVTVQYSELSISSPYIHISPASSRHARIRRYFFWYFVFISSLSSGLQMNATNRFRPASNSACCHAGLHYFSTTHGSSRMMGIFFAFFPFRLQVTHRVRVLLFGDPLIPKASRWALHSSLAWDECGIYMHGLW